MKNKAVSALLALGLAAHFPVAMAAADPRSIGPRRSGTGQDSKDPLKHLQWGLASIHAEKAWTVTRGRRSKVAVLDSGIQASHPDLVENVSRRISWACEGNPRRDSDGHGTHVAGIIAATENNGEGIVGVAPEATLIAVKRSGDCSYDEAIRAAAELYADVINMSQGYGLEGYPYAVAGRLDAMKEAVRYAWSKGAVITVSAGNSRHPLCAEPWLDVPVVCVGALDRHDRATTYTNRDVAMVSDYVMAPGGEDFPCEDGIVSTYVVKDPDVTDPWTCDLPEGYDSFGGTSMAAPHVAGVAALLSSLGLNNRQIVACILETTTDLGASGRDSLYGYGKIDAWRAVTSCR